MPTRTARPATRARLSGAGCARACSPRCGCGGLDTECCRRRMTGRGHTRAGAGERRSSDCGKEIGRRQVSSPACWEAGTRPGRRPSWTQIGTAVAGLRRRRRQAQRASTRPGSTRLAAKRSNTQASGSARLGRRRIKGCMPPTEGHPVDRGLNAPIRRSRTRRHSRPGRSARSSGRGWPTTTPRAATLTRTSLSRRAAIALPNWVRRVGFVWAFTARRL